MSTSTYTATKPALLFIPDISGFTKFVSNTEVTHARHIINELLECIVESDELGLEISEFEGDAILFYKYGKAPTAPEIVETVQKMFVNFQAELKRYDKFRICDCGACSTANNLTLKFFAHYGDISEHKIRDHNNLFGSDVILIHRLMKNNIDSDEYSLFTSSLQESCHTWSDVDKHTWAKLENSKEDYDLGPVNFSFLPLTPLMEQVPEPTAVPFKLKGKMMELFSSEGEIDAPIDLVFNVVSDLGFRNKWQDGLIAVDGLNTKITQNGSGHRCVINNNNNNPYFVAHDFQRKNEVITFFETEQEKGLYSQFTLTPIGTNKTHIRILGHLKNNPIKKFFFNLFLKNKFHRSGEKSLASLNDYCKSLVAEGRDHGNAIVLKEKG